MCHDYQSGKVSRVPSVQDSAFRSDSTSPSLLPPGAGLARYKPIFQHYWNCVRTAVGKDSSAQSLTCDEARRLGQMQQLAPDSYDPSLPSKRVCYYVSPQGMHIATGYR